MFEEEESIKVVFVGECNVGKTTIMMSFVTGKPHLTEEEEEEEKKEEKKQKEEKNEDKKNTENKKENKEKKDKKNIVSTNGASYLIKSLLFERNNKILKFELFDSAGQKKYRFINRMFYKDANAVVIVYDITSKNSFEEIKNFWGKEIKENCPPETIIAIVGNKSHLFDKEEVSEEEAKQYAESINAIFMLVSTKYMSGVKELFEVIGQRYLGLNINDKDNKDNEENKDDEEKHKDFLLELLKFQKL